MAAETLADARTQLRVSLSRLTRRGFSFMRLQARQFPAHAGNAGADQGLVVTSLKEKLIQDRR
jgi:hypothetical protein